MQKGRTEVPACIGTEGKTLVLGWSGMMEPKLITSKVVTYPFKQRQKNILSIIYLHGSSLKFYDLQSIQVSLLPKFREKRFGGGVGKENNSTNLEVRFHSLT